MWLTPIIVIIVLIAGFILLFSEELFGLVRLKKNQMVITFHNVKDKPIPCDRTILVVGYEDTVKVDHFDAKGVSHYGWYVKAWTEMPKVPEKIEQIKHRIDKTYLKTGQWIK